MNMFINTKNIAAKALTLICATALTLSSCVQLGEEQDGAYGYLTITGFDVNVQVEQLVPTKGANLPNISEPNESDIVYKVTDKNGKVYQSNDNSWVSPLRIPVGSYTLEAWSGSNEKFGSPYFYGKTENASINIGNNTGNVTLYVANSLVAVSLGEDLEGHFAANEGKCVKLSVSDNSYVEATLGEYVFVPSGKELNVTVSGTPKDFKSKLTADPKTAHNVIISAHGILSSAQMSWGDKIVITDPVKLMEGTVMDNIKYQAIPSDSNDWTESRPSSKSEDGIHVINGLDKEKTYKVRAVLPNNTYSNEVEVISISAKAEHSTTDGLLDGTDIITNVVFPTSLNNSNPTISYELTDNSSKGVGRTFNENPDVSVADSDGSTSDANWPYLPKDYSYNLKATIIVNGKQISSMTTIEVPAPEFEVTSGAYTSYSLYLGGNATEANKCGADTIYNLQSVTPKIAQALLGNPKYNKSQSVKVNGGSPITSDKISVQEWKEYIVAASYTFAGTTCSTDHKVHITGLPYTVSFQNNTSPNGWSFSNKSSGGSGTSRIILKEGTAYALSPIFHVPNDLEVSAILNCYAYGGSVYKPYKPTVNFVESNSGTNSGNVEATLSGSNLLPNGGASYINVSGFLTLTSNIKRVCIYTNGEKDWWSVGGVDIGVVCDHFILNYKQ